MLAFFPYVVALECLPELNVLEKINLVYFHQNDLNPTLKTFSYLAKPIFPKNIIYGKCQHSVLSLHFANTM